MRLATTLCGLTLALAVAAQRPPSQDAIPVKPVTEDYQDFSARDIAPAISARLDSAYAYGVPFRRGFTKKGLGSWVCYINSVKVPERDTLASPQEAVFSLDSLRFSGNGDDHLPNRFAGDAAYYYFANDSYTLSRTDSADVKALADYCMESWPGGVPRIVIEARADLNHTAAYNYVLSIMRGYAIASLMNEYLPDIPVEIVAFGNASPLCEGEDEMSLAKNRVVRALVGDKTAVERGFDCIDADDIFGDASSSAFFGNGCGYSSWEVFKNYDFKNGNVFIFHKELRREHDGGKYVFKYVPWPNGRLITYYEPEGDTPLKEVLMFTAVMAKPGTSHCFQTDGYASPSAVEYEHIISVAQQRGISFSFVGAGKMDKCLRDLQEVAFATGGQTYFAFSLKNIRLLTEMIQGF